MEDSMDIMKDNMSLASSLLTGSFSKSSADLPVSRRSEVAVCAVETEGDGLTSNDVLESSMGSLSLAFSPAFSARSPVSVAGLSKTMLKPLEIRSRPSNARNKTNPSGNSQTPVVNSTTILTQGISAPVNQSMKRVSVPTNSTLFPDLIRIPEKNGFSNPVIVGGMRKSSIVWFRNDLRVHDNEALFTAHSESMSVLPVYVFDPRDYGKSSSGFDRTGPYRAQFLLDCLADLRSNLKAMGSDLLVRVGNPEEVIPKLARSVGAEAVFAHQEVSKEDIASEQRVITALQADGVNAHFYWGSTLYHKDDLPFSSLEAMPTNYAGFKEQTSNVQVRSTMEAPSKLKPTPGKGTVDMGQIPTLKELGVRAPSGNGNGVKNGPGLIGGENEALKRLVQFMAEAKSALSASMASKKDSSLMGANFSCKISPWLAMGCVSPRKMFQDLKYSNSSSSGDSGLSWLQFELLWRDFFRFISMRYNSTEQQALACSA